MKKVSQLFFDLILVHHMLAKVESSTLAGSSSEAEPPSFFATGASTGADFNGFEKLLGAFQYTQATSTAVLFRSAGTHQYCSSRKETQKIRFSTFDPSIRA